LPRDEIFTAHPDVGVPPVLPNYGAAIAIHHGTTEILTATSGTCQWETTRPNGTVRVGCISHATQNV